jgi:hypothetical protein
MTIATPKTRPQITHATHVTKPPISNRQNLARLEIAATPTKQSPNPISNRQFFDPSTPLPWIQLQHEALQLIQTGHPHRTNSANAPKESPVAPPAPQGRQRLGRSVRAGRENESDAPSAGGAAREASVAQALIAAPTLTAPHAKTTRFLISRSAIRNRRNPLKTRGRGDF